MKNMLSGLRNFRWLVCLALLLSSSTMNRACSQEQASNGAAPTVEKPLGEKPLGIDEQIDKAFDPIETSWEGLVLSSSPAMPFLLLLLENYWVFSPVNVRLHTDGVI